MPVAQQRDSRAYMAMPRRTSALDFASASLANWVRLGLLMSATLNVGCLPVLLATQGWAGSQPVGCGPPGTPVQSVPMVTQPVLPDEKSGGRCWSCAIAAPAHRRLTAAAPRKRDEAAVASPVMAIPPSRLSMARSDGSICWRDYDATAACGHPPSRRAGGWSSL